MLHEVVERCRQRDREGDSPTVEAFSVEILENAILELAKMREPRTFRLKFNAAWLENKIRTDPNSDCEVGSSPLSSNKSNTGE